MKIWKDGAIYMSLNGSDPMAIQLPPIDAHQVVALDKPNQAHMDPSSLQLKFKDWKKLNGRHDDTWPNEVTPRDHSSRSINCAQQDNLNSEAFTLLSRLCMILDSRVGGKYY